MQGRFLGPTPFLVAAAVLLAAGIGEFALLRTGDGSCLEPDSGACPQGSVTLVSLGAVLLVSGLSLAAVGGARIPLALARVAGGAPSDAGDTAGRP